MSTIEDVDVDEEGTCPYCGAGSDEVCDPDCEAEEYDDDPSEDEYDGMVEP